MRTANTSGRWRNRGLRTRDRRRVTDRADLYSQYQYQPFLRSGLSHLAIGSFLGLVTYFVHGALNNFLDTDKLSVPVWAFMAMVVAMDVYHTQVNQASQRQSSLLGKDLLH